MKCICLADLTELIVFEKWVQSAATDGGGQVGEWIPSHEILANAEEKFGLEKWMAQQLTAVKWLDIGIGYNPEITETLSLTYRGVIYNVRSVIADKKKLFMYIKAEGGVRR